MPPAIERVGAAREPRVLDCARRFFAVLGDLSHARSRVLPASELPRRYERQRLRAELLFFFFV